MKIMETTTKICDYCKERIAISKCSICNCDLCESCELTAKGYFTFYEEDEVSVVCNKINQVCGFCICEKCSKIEWDKNSINLANKFIKDTMKNGFILSKVEEKS